MAVTTRKLYVPENLTTDEQLIKMFRTIVDRVEKPRVPNVPYFELTISNPPNQAEVAAVATLLNAVLFAMKESGIMEADA